MTRCVRFCQFQHNFIWSLSWICPKKVQNHLWGSYFLKIGSKKVLKFHNKLQKNCIFHFSTRFPFQHRALHIHLNLRQVLLWQEMCKRCWNGKTNSLIANKLDGVSLTHFFRNTKKKLGTISQKGRWYLAIAFEGFEEVPKDSYSLSCRKSFSL